MHKTSYTVSSNYLPSVRLGLSTFPGYFSGWSMGGVEVYSTPSLINLEEILFEKSKALD
jgi:hypothetical protein